MASGTFWLVPLLDRADAPAPCDDDGLRRGAVLLRGAGFAWLDGTLVRGAPRATARTCRFSVDELPDMTPARSVWVAVR